MPKTLMTSHERSIENNDGTTQCISNNSNCSNSAGLPPDIERLRRCIVEYVDQNDLKMLFWELHNPFQDVDEMLCIQAAVLLSKMDDTEKNMLVNQLVTLVQQSRAENHPSSGTYEKVIDVILTYSMEEEVLPVSTAIAGIILTADFTLKFGLTAEKWKLVAQHIEVMDIKGIRHVFKTLTESQLVQIPKIISCEQRMQLIPVEELLLNILNKVPPIFTMTEISRNRDITLYRFPRVVERLSEIKAYFRPLADLSFVVGRSFMYPILAHPQFNAISASWKVDNNSTALCGRFTYLPNRKEVSSPQNYLFYMVVKQPRGKETLMNMLRNVSRNPSKNCFEGLLSIIISETMAAVEDLPPDAEIPRYQWDHILTIIVFAMHHNHTNANGVVSVLHAILERRQYRRARDEVMWLMLQIAGSSFGGNLDRDQIEKLAALYKLLYNDEVSWSGASDHPSQLVRFLSTACMYILLEGKEGLPPPSKSLEGQIQFIREHAVCETVDDQVMMAVLLNAYRSETAIVRRVLRQYTAHLDGQPGDEPFYLPYNKLANSKLASLEIQLIDALAMRAKMHLLQVCSGAFRNTQQRLPSPAVVDTYAKMLYTVDYDYGLKSFVLMLQKAANAMNTSHTDANKDLVYLIVDVLCNRLTNMTIPGSVRQTIGLTVIGIMHHASATLVSLELYSICEQTLMRLFSWAPFSETMGLATAFLGSDRSVFAHLCKPSLFTNPAGEPTPFHVCPEVVRMLFISMMRTVKIMEYDVSEDIEFFQRIAQVYSWTPTQMQSFPLSCRSLHQAMIDENTGTAMPEEMRNAVHSDFVQMRGLPDGPYLDYMTQPERQPTTLCVIFRALLESENADLSRTFPVFYQILERLNARQLIVSINWLSEYVIQQCGESNNDVFPSAVRVLNMMMFHLHVVRFDRLLLSLVLHPSNDHKAQIGLLIVKYLVETPEVQERITFYCQTVPRKENHPAEFFKRLAEYHRKYPEYTFGELSAMTAGQREPEINSRLHYPIYYGSLIERLLPIVDYTLSRALETSMVDAILSSMLKVLAQVYKYHPSPITFVYSVLHSMHDHLGHLPRARQFVLNIFSQREETQLTQTFVAYNHQKIGSLEDLLTELIERIIECSEFVLLPPSYVSQDWRFSELTPAAQALYLSCIELLASPHGPQHIVPAMISLLCSSRQVRSRPYTTLNAIGSILTALPEAYGKVLQDHFVQTIQSGVLNEFEFEDIVFDNFEESVHLHMTKREVVINAMMQAYWHHGNQFGVSKFTAFFMDVVYSHISTENELWYFIRLMLPLQQWVFERDKNKIKHWYGECVKQVRGLLLKTEELAESGKPFKHGEELCDLFYHLKYMFVGDSLMSEAERIFPKLPANMREQLKYYLTPPSGKHDEDHGGKSSTVLRPDMTQLFKTHSDASEKN